MGYSMPATDLSTSGMLAEALSSGSAAEIRIVDFRPGKPKDTASIESRVRALGSFRPKVRSIGEGLEAIPDYVKSLVDEAATDAVAQLRKRRGDGRCLMFVDWGEEQNQALGIGRSAAIVKSLGINDEGILILETDPLGSIHLAHSSRSVQIQLPGGPSKLSRPLAFSDVQEDVQRATRVQLKVPGSSRLITIIAATERHFAGGEGDGQWLSLVPAGVCS